MASQLQASEAETGSLPSSHSVICQHPYQEVLLPASLWGQRWAVHDFPLLLPTPPSPTQHLLPDPIPPPYSSQPAQPAQPRHQLTSSTWGPRPSRIRCAASAFFCRAKRREKLKEDLEQTGTSASGTPNLHEGSLLTL